MKHRFTAMFLLVLSCAALAQQQPQTQNNDDDDDDTPAVVATASPDHVPPAPAPIGTATPSSPTSGPTKISRWNSLNLKPVPAGRPVLQLTNAVAWTDVMDNRLVAPMDSVWQTKPERVLIDLRYYDCGAKTGVMVCQPKAR